jgi:hypothetical protein
MATVNLGSIKFKWKGAYAGGTAYVVDDVVSYNGSSYMCKLASTGNLPTNGTYWDVMAQAGTDGTDVGTTITTQGDILYRDGSGLQRLAAGTAGQLLKTGGSGANPSWTDAPSGVIKKIHVWEKYGRIGSLSNSTTNHFVWTNTNVTTDSGSNYTPLDRVNNDLMIDWQIASWGNGNNVSNVGIRFTGDTSGTNYDYQHRGHAQSAPTSYSYIHRGHFRIPKNEVIGNGTETFSIYYRAFGANGHEDYINPNSSNDGRIGGASPWSGQTSTLQITEFKN